MRRIDSGSKPGKEVVQLYLTDKPGGTTRRLLAFQKVALAPGESRKVTLTADPRLLGQFDTGKHGWVIAPGNYTVAIGRDAGTMTVSGSTRLAAATMRP